MMQIIIMKKKKQALNIRLINSLCRIIKTAEDNANAVMRSCMQI